MPSGGARRGAGAKRKLKPQFGSKTHVQSVLNKLGKPYRGYCVELIPKIYQLAHLPTEDDLWLSLLLSEDKRIKLDTLKYLKNRAEGEPSHQINHTVQHLIAVEEGRQLARKMLALKNRKTLEAAPSLEPEPLPSASGPASEQPSQEKAEEPGTPPDRTRIN